ncbi:MAG: hypothetical protein KF851_16615 [Pirellulaceae bacterium]|nr:hypothetical protein [Pirellulaceae bacterium]
MNSTWNLDWQWARSGSRPDFRCYHEIPNRLIESLDDIRYGSRPKVLTTFATRKSPGPSADQLHLLLQGNALNFWKRVSRVTRQVARPGMLEPTFPEFP